MNTSKANGYNKLLVFFLIAVLLIFAFGFVADGWQLVQVPDEDNNGKTEDENGNADENKDPTQDENGGGENEPEIPEEPNEPEIYVPEYVDYLTGLETTEELAKKRPISFVMNSSSPLYSISRASIIAEFPLENGDSRLLAFATDTDKLGKVGALSQTRGYISNISKSFGSILVSCGSDDRKDYETVDVAASHFDLTKFTGYHYTEFQTYCYSNGDLIDAGIANANIGTAVNSRQLLPYVFNEFGAEAILGEANAKSVVIPYSADNVTELYYSEDIGGYTFAKNGAVKTDMLYDKCAVFENAFILFADTVTYEGADGVEMIMSTIGCGTGYYVTEGTLMNISWSVTASGDMTFTSEEGERLVINRGSSYIGFFKSSRVDEIKIS